MSPLVAEIYGPDEAGRQKLAARVAAAFAANPDIVGIDTSLREDAPRAFLRVRRQRAESLGIPVAAVAQTVLVALSGTDAAYLHDGTVQIPGARAHPAAAASRRSDWMRILALPMRAANGQLVPLSRTGPGGARRDRQAAQYQGPARSELCVWRHGRHAGLAALRAVRHPLRPCRRRPTGTDDRRW